MARDVIVGIFNNRDQAYDAAVDINGLSDDIVDVKSGAIVEKDVLGNVSTLDTKNIGNAWGTVGGLAGGALIGALIGLLAGPGGAAVGSAAGAAAAGAGAATGGAVGGTVGAAADVTNWSLNEDYLDEVSAMLLPGKAALVMEAEEGSTAPVDTAVTRYGGIVYRSPIDAVMP
jgi:uncharacterized membrane protein